MITLEYRRDFWTICINGRPTFTFANLGAALAAVPEARIVVQS